MSIKLITEQERVEIEALHGDSSDHPIIVWVKERSAGQTDLDYIDWRADRMWCRANARRVK